MVYKPSRNDAGKKYKKNNCNVHRSFKMALICSYFDTPLMNDDELPIALI